MTKRFPRQRDSGSIRIDSHQSPIGTNFLGYHAGEVTCTASKVEDKFACWVRGEDLVTLRVHSFCIIWIRIFKSGFGFSVPFTRFYKNPISDCNPNNLPQIADSPDLFWIRFQIFRIFTFHLSISNPDTWPWFARTLLKVFCRRNGELEEYD